MRRLVVLSAESAAFGIMLADRGMAPLCGEFWRLPQRILFWNGDRRCESPVRSVDVSSRSQRRFVEELLEKSRTLQT